MQLIFNLFAFVINGEQYLHISLTFNVLLFAQRYKTGQILFRLSLTRLNHNAQQYTHACMHLKNTKDQYFLIISNSAILVFLTQGETFEQSFLVYRNTREESQANIAISLSKGARGAQISTVTKISIESESKFYR